MSVAPPVISVVIPTKGRVPSLGSCLEALERADYERDRFEVVVSNDRGMREVESLVAAFGDRLRVSTITPERSGPSAARNAGASAASGEYVAFTDDDCEPEAGWLTALERSLVANPGAAAGGAVRNGAPQNLGAVATQAVVDALHAGFNRDPGRRDSSPPATWPFPRGVSALWAGSTRTSDTQRTAISASAGSAAGNRFVSAPDAVVVHMRTLDLREFMGQHYGYGRGAFAFNGMQSSERRRGDRVAVLGRLAREALRRHDGQSRLAVAAYLLLSQLATAAGFVARGGRPVDRASAAARIRREAMARSSGGAAQAGEKRRPIGRDAKIVVVMPALNAAGTLAETVSGIPSEWVDEMILVDDKSSDATVELARALSVQVVWHPHTVGYGGNQKTCYLEALQRGADAVVMLHPDGQYEPEIIPKMLTPILEDQADMVLGSRFAEPGAARAGGMPLYKYVANRVLTSIENRGPGHRVHRAPHRLPRLLEGASAHRPVPAQLDRLQLRLRDADAGRRSSAFGSPRCRRGRATSRAPPRWARGRRRSTG